MQTSSEGRDERPRIATDQERHRMDSKPRPSADPHAPVASELPSHGYVITKPVRGSDVPADYTWY